MPKSFNALSSFMRSSASKDVPFTAVVGRAGLRSAARGDLVVPGHRTEWGSRSFAVKCWNKLPVGLRDLSVGPETFARRLKTHLFRVGFSD